MTQSVSSSVKLPEKCRWVSIRPGRTVLPAASMTSTPSGRSCMAPAYSILPLSSTRTREFSTGSAPVPSMSLPPTIAYLVDMVPPYGSIYVGEAVLGRGLTKLPKWCRVRCAGERAPRTRSAPARRYFLRELVKAMRARPIANQPITMLHSTMLREAGENGITSRPMMMAQAAIARLMPNLPPGTS